MLGNNTKVEDITGYLYGYVPQAFQIHGEVSFRHKDETVGSDLVDWRKLLLKRLAFHQQNANVFTKPRVRFRHQRAAAHGQNVPRISA